MSNPMTKEMFAEFSKHFSDYEATQPKDEPWSPVSIGVDVTKEGAHVVGIYALDKDTSQIFYAKHHPAPQRTWVGLTYEDMVALQKDLYDAKGESVLPTTFAMAVEAKLKEKNGC